MKRPIATRCLVIILGYILLPAQAAVVHKWVDADGVTHYSDTAPGSPTTQVSVIDLPEPNWAKTNVDDDYYSIRNQWQRIYKERLEKQKLELEKARQQAASEAATPQVVYIKESHEKQYAIGYPGSFHRRHGHKRLHKKYRRHHGYVRNQYHRGKTPIGLHPGRLKLGSYRLSQ